MQVKCALNIERSLKGEAPTLRQLLFTYDVEQVRVWLMAHMMDLNAFVGVREKMQLEQMEMLANVFITKCMFIKASEVLLFFHKLKCGDLIEFYGAVDPLKVSIALNAFMTWRAAELNKIEVKRKEEKRLQQLEDSKKTAITREEYEQLKERKK